MARVTAIIPARLASKRFSRKVLHPLNDKPLIYHV
ncbi:MAG: 3-deoxy-manno-octulosonate cytidylyltransferase, partial [FCB group bacterium]|nr:3-deoxy-manno-octulosonate cytidylyltransferase [FCB group bacterium]